jgi:DNA-binding transcriptional ArsR family regulator
MSGAIGRFLLLMSLAISAVAGEPIRSRAALDEHLRQHSQDSPINALSPGARERFLYSLRFNDNGLVGASGVDLADELTQPQIVAVMALFGEEVVKYAPDSHSEELRWLEKRVRNRGEIGAIERRYIDYFKAVTDIEDADGEARVAKRAAAFDRHLKELYEGRALDRVDDRELRLLRRAAQEVAMATRAPEHLEAFQAIFAERRSRDLVSRDDLITLQSLMLALHRLADARRVTADYPGMDLPRLPRFVDTLEGTGRPTVWRLDADGRVLTREIVDLTAPQIIVTGSCHFAKDAAQELGTDPLFGPVFARHARWLTLAPGIEQIDDVRAWNRALPHSPMLMIYDRSEWNLLPSWREPEFHIVRDGRVLESSNGWVRGSRQHRDNLASLLRRHGLME